MGEVSAPDQDILLQMSARPSLVHLLRVRGQGILSPDYEKINMFKVSLELTCQRCLTTTHCLF